MITSVIIVSFTIVLIVIIIMIIISFTIVLIVIYVILLVLLLLCLIVTVVVDLPGGKAWWHTLQGTKRMRQ